MPSFYRTRALAKWGFSCSCPLCAASARETEESDRRRERIANLFDDIVGTQHDYDTVVNLTREFFGLAEKENLTEKFAEYHHALLWVYYQHGDLESTLQHGETALKYAAAFGDPNDEFCRSLRALLTRTRLKT